MTVGGRDVGILLDGQCHGFRPAITITIDMTDANTGRSMKCLSVIGYSSFSVWV